MKKPSDNTPLGPGHYSKKEADELVQGLLNSAILKQLSESPHIQAGKESRADIKNVSPILLEYFDNFILIGHDLLGNEVVLSYAATQNDKNAITKLFHDSFIRLMLGHQNGNSPL